MYMQLNEFEYKRVFTVQYSNCRREKCERCQLYSVPWESGTLRRLITLIKLIVARYLQVRAHSVVLGALSPGYSQLAARN